MAYDILIKGGTVFDGRGNSPKVADVAIKGDAVEDVRDQGEEEGTITIDGRGKYVTPGFVDITNHSDTRLSLFHAPQLESMVMQGVTTAIGGNCGGSLAPLASEHAINAIRKWADPSTINTDWNTFGEYLDALEREVRPGINFGSFAGYSTLRRGVIGEDARLLEPQELEQVQYLLRQACAEGAFGLSLGLSYGHERVSTTDEIISVCQAIRETGGIVKIHLRSEGDEILASVNEAIRIGREVPVPIQINHLKAIGKRSWPLLPRILELIEQTRSSGLDIAYDVSPYATTGSSLYLLIPPGARHGGFEELFRRIDNPEEKTRLMEELKTLTLHYDTLRITSAKTKQSIGHTIAEAAKHMGVSPEEALLNIVRANEGLVSIIGKTVSEENTIFEIRDENSCIASDGVGLPQQTRYEQELAHPRSFGAFPRLWAKYVQDERILSPEQAIRKMTSLPAERLGLKKRGVLERGAFADIVVFDPRLFRDRATEEDPRRYPAGLEWVIINGTIVVREGKMIGTRAGRVLRR